MRTGALTDLMAAVGAAVVGGIGDIMAAVVGKISAKYCGKTT